MMLAARTDRPAQPPFLERRPILSAVLILLVVKLAFMASMLVSTALLGGASTLPGAAMTVALLGLIALVAWRMLERRGWASMVGFNRLAQWRQPWLAAFPALLVLANLAALAGAEIKLDVDWPLLMNAVVRAVTVPLVEETVFRGLILAVLLNRFHATSEEVLKAVLLANMLFGLWHLPPNPDAPWQQGVANVIYAFLLGVGFAAASLRTRSIWLVMIVHGLIVLGGALVPMLITQKAGTIAELIPPDQAWRSALLSIAVTVPLFLYGLWLLRDIGKLRLPFR